MRKEGGTEAMLKIELIEFISRLKVGTRKMGQINLQDANTKFNTKLQRKEIGK